MMVLANSVFFTSFFLKDGSLKLINSFADEGIGIDRKKHACSAMAKEYEKKNGDN
jgi:hypothetical protein